MTTLPTPDDVRGFRSGYGKSGQARELYVAGTSTFEIAVFLNLSHAYVRRAVRDLPPAKAAPKRDDVDEDDDRYFWKWARTHIHGKRQARPGPHNFQGRYRNG